MTASRASRSDAPAHQPVAEAGPGDVPRRRRRELLARYVTIAMVMASIVLVWILLEAKKQETFADAERAAISRARSLASALEEEFRAKVSVADQTLRYVRDAYLAEPDQFRLSDWQQAGRFITETAVQIGMTDAKGMLLSTNLANTKPIDLSDREHVRVHLQDGPDVLFISKPVLGRVSKRWTIQLSRRMAFPDGRLAGVIVGSLEIDQIVDFHTRVRIGEKGTIMLVGEDGVIRSAAPRGKPAAGDDLASNPQWAFLKSPKDLRHVFHSHGPNEPEMIQVANHVRDTALWLVVGQDRDEVLAEARIDARWHMLSGLFATVWLLALLAIITWYNHGLSAARDSAEAARKSKARLLAVMSHEIRTPLNGILGIAELLGATKLAQREAGLVTTLKDSALYLRGLVNDILDFSRLEAKREDLDLQDLDLRQLADGVIALLAPNAAAQGNALVLNVAPSVAPAHLADGGKIRRILLNLVGNALKFTERGTVSVSIALESEMPDGRQQLAITIADSGCGIPADKLPKLFREFVQADASIQNRYGGSGLGLMITDRLVRAMDGAIQVQSEPGRGSTFTVRLALPRGEAAHIAPVQVASASPQGLPARRNVLAADDNRTNQIVIGEYLRQLGQDFVVVSSGEAALEAFARQDFDLVLLDVIMPGLGGLEACRLMRAQGGRAAEIPILALTGGTDPEEIGAARAAGMDGVLAKPLTIEALAAYLHESGTKADVMPAEAPVEAASNERPATEAQHDRDSEIEGALARLGSDIGEECIDEVVQIFLDECRTCLAELGTALASADASRVHRLAHTLKGSAGGLGFRSLSSAALALEKAGKAGTLEGAEPLLETVTREGAQIESWVERHSLRATA